MTECHEDGCAEQAVMAILTNRPTRENLYTKIFWDNRSQGVPKKTEHYCADHGFNVFDSLWRVLAK